MHFALEISNLTYCLMLFFFEFIIYYRTVNFSRRSGGDPLSIYFGEDKTKSILFGRRNTRTGSKKLDIMRDDIKIKQHTSVTYLGRILDENLSGESMDT